MNYAIIAAGEGSRLAQEGVSLPKPLVRLHGEPMIERLARIMSRNHAQSINIIVNEQMTDVQEAVRRLDVGVPLNVVVKTTPSSMHSFWHLSRVMPAGKLCLTTVDTVFREDDFSRYVEAFEQDDEHDGLWAVTPFIDDEKPLYVDVDGQLNITAFRDDYWPEARFVSGGVYAMTDRAFAVLDRCLEQGVSRMRNFQRALVDNGFNLGAFVIDKIVDVDHAADIATAEAFLDEKSEQ